MAEVDTTLRDAEIERQRKAESVEQNRIIRAQEAREAARSGMGRGGRILENIMFRARGGESQFETPLGDQMPESPNLITDPTSITLPGEDQPRTVSELGQAAVDADFQKAEDQFTADTAVHDEAVGISEDIRGSMEDIGGALDTELEDNQARQDAFDLELETARSELENLPANAITEFERLRGEFDTLADASFARTDAARQEALNNVMVGRSQAMEAAVQGVQGNVNNQISQIRSNPNLTSAQKQSMISQVSLQGAMSMGPIIGSSVLAFNQLSADVSMKFGEISGNLEATALGVKGQLMGMQGSAFANAQVEVGRMTNELLNIQASADASYTNSQSQLLGMKSEVDMAGNGLLAQLLSAMATPYLDLTAATNNAYITASTIMMDQFQLEAGEFQMKLNIAAIRESSGNWVSRLVDGIFSGFSVAGNKKGAALGAIGAVAGDSGEAPPV